MKQIEHGTYAGYQRHGRRGETACGPCRQANPEYMRQYRAARADQRALERQRNDATTRALWRLKRIHPEEFQDIYVEEMER